MRPTDQVALTMLASAMGKSEAQSEIARLRADNEQLLRFLDFANLWCNRKSKISAKERLEAIQYHPIAQKRLKEAGTLPE